ncbi:MAG: chloride channel protein [Gammaproteobacteria bacterium]|nr:chloride channel protein [Rhodocyclaceae bacterium]MBU3908555.1 chloride channel protein [Gammaproteobacteria bacterium]MBU3990299.1 chloride channel protein [Gammaproteobacteria bacterium]MBU4004583.1 chloride channel protein [Gammaproteobacteria bacterium]MBU4021186.1 chloride channel protein [Gammaproteobacteria bacterium]
MTTRLEKLKRSLQTPALKRFRHRFLSPRLWLRGMVFWGGSIGVGLAAVLFALGAEKAEHYHRLLLGLSPYLPLLITPLGLAGVTWVTRRYFVGSQGSGIPQTIAALDSAQIRDRVLSLRIAFGKIMLTLVGLSCGASVGREGPTVQVGAAIMHSLGRLVRFSRVQSANGLILAGGAAGVAAAFNTPLAGIVFAIEEMSRSSFQHRTNGTILTGVILAGITSMAILGNHPYFGQTSASLPFDQAWIAVVLCGGACGLLGGLFARLLIAMSRGLPGRPGELARAHPVAFAAACGFVLALIGLISGSTVYGTGYTEARHILEASEQLPAEYGVLKFLATLVSYASGIPGGIFAPSLAVGAGFGLNLAEIMPYAPVGAVVLLAMVAYFAGVVQAPITAFVIVMEMTDNHDMVMPLMATALIATAVSRLVCPRPLYRTLAERFLTASPPPPAKGPTPEKKAP